MDKIGQPIRGVDTDADLTRADHSIGAAIGERRERSGRGLDEAVMRLVDEGQKKGERRTCMHIQFSRICEVRRGPSFRGRRLTEWLKYGYYYGDYRALAQFMLRTRK